MSRYLLKRVEFLRMRKTKVFKLTRNKRITVVFIVNRSRRITLTNERFTHIRITNQKWQSAFLAALAKKNSKKLNKNRKYTQYRSQRKTLLLIRMLQMPLFVGMQISLSPRVSLPTARF
jgi:hypothetical protein